MSYYGDDDYDYDRRRRRPSPHRYRSDRRTTQLLSPNYDGGGLYRSRSQGQAPVPVVNVYNDLVQDGSFRNTSVSPPYSPRLDRGRLSSDFADEFAELSMENRRLRSRSRGRSDAGALTRPNDYLEYELRDRERQLRELERKEALELEEQRIKDKYEMQRIKDEAKRKADEEAAKADRKRVIEEYERKKIEEKEEEKRMRERVEEQQRKEKEREKKEYEDFLRRQKEAEEKRKADEKREWEEFLRKQKEAEEKKKKEEKEKEEELEAAMRERLMKHGYTWAQAERMIQDKKDEPVNRTTTTMTTTTRRSFGDSSYRPTYAKIKKEYLSVDTLRYYDIPYELDRDDDRYIIILREMDKYETDVLFEHTRRLRAGKLLLEPPKKEKEYAWYRKRDRSSSRVRKVGILEFTK